MTTVKFCVYHNRVNKVNYSFKRFFFNIKQFSVRATYWLQMLIDKKSLVSHTLAYTDQMPSYVLSMCDRSFYKHTKIKSKLDVLLDTVGRHVSTLFKILLGSRSPEKAQQNEQIRRTSVVLPHLSFFLTL